MKNLAIRSVILVTVISLWAAVLAAAVAGQEQGLLNPGFETGDLDPWERGYVPATDYISVRNGDSFANHYTPAYSTGNVVVEPRYGDYMARVGKPDATLTGAAELYQDFTVPADGVARFAYRMCTYDDREDYFAYRVTLVEGTNEAEVAFALITAPASNSTGAAWCQEAWTDVAVDLSPYAGRLARVKVSAGDTNGSRSTWAYVDAPLPAVVPDTQADPEGDATNVVVDVKPDTLNLGTTEGDGTLTVYLELPAGLSLADVDFGSVVLSVNGAEFSPEATGNGLGDYDSDGVPDRMFKFRRAAVLAAVGSASDSVTFTLAGGVGGASFEGSDTVRVLQKSASVNRANSKAR